MTHSESVLEGVQYTRAFHSNALVIGYEPFPASLSDWVFVSYVVYPSKAAE